MELLDGIGEDDTKKLEELRPQLESTNAIVARPWNDWELGLSLGRWGIFKQGYYLVSQGISAVGAVLRTSMTGGGRARPEKATGASGGDE